MSGCWNLELRCSGVFCAWPVWLARYSPRCGLHRFVAASDGSAMAGKQLYRDGGVGVAFDVMDHRARYCTPDVARAAVQVVTGPTPSPLGHGSGARPPIAVFVESGGGAHVATTSVSPSGPFATVPIIGSHRAIGVVSMDHVRTAGARSRGSAVVEELTPADLAWLSRVGEIVGSHVTRVRCQAALGRIKESTDMALQLTGNATPRVSQQDSPVPTWHDIGDSGGRHDHDALARASRVCAAALGALRSCLVYSRAEHILGLPTPDGLVCVASSSSAQEEPVFPTATDVMPPVGNVDLESLVRRRYVSTPCHVITPLQRDGLRVLQVSTISEGRQDGDGFVPTVVCSSDAPTALCLSTLRSPSSCVVPAAAVACVVPTMTAMPRAGAGDAAIAADMNQQLVGEATYVHDLSVCG